MKKRELYINSLSKYINTPIVKIIVGIRRCGKSYLLKLLKLDLISKGIDENNIIYYDLESIRYDKVKDYKSFYNDVVEMVDKVEGKSYILIDEIQEIDQWELAIRSLMVDIDCDLYVTGSNAHLLSSELATHLAGRYVELQLFTLSFKEYLNFNDIDINNKLLIERSFDDFVKYGAFPGLYHMPKDDEVISQYLLGIYNSVVLKDVVQRNNIRNSELLERVLVFIMDNIGQLFSGKRIVDYLKAQGVKISTETIYNHLDALENAMIIHPAKRYDIKGKRLLQRMDKYFVADLGLRFAILGYRANDISQILENIVYLELVRRGYNVYVGKEGDFEVDFIAVKGEEKIYYQVAYLLASADVVDREYRSLKNINDNYRKYVLSLDHYPIGADEGIEWVNIIEFLLGG